MISANVEPRICWGCARFGGLLRFRAQYRPLMKALQIAGCRVVMFRGHNMDTFSRKTRQQSAQRKSSVLPRPGGIRRRSPFSVGSSRNAIIRLSLRPIAARPARLRYATQCHHHTLRPLQPPPEHSEQSQDSALQEDLTATAHSVGGGPRRRRSPRARVNYRTEGRRPRQSFLRAEVPVAPVEPQEVVVRRLTRRRSGG